MDILTEWTGKARVGGDVVINGERYTIEEIVTYRQEWVNIVIRDQRGREIAVEAVQSENKGTLWQKVPKFRDLRREDQPAIRYRGENYSLIEKGTAHAIVETADGHEASEVPYWVYHSESGRQLAVEIWDGQFYCSVAEPTAPQVSF